MTGYVQKIKVVISTLTDLIQFVDQGNTAVLVLLDILAAPPNCRSLPNKVLTTMVIGSLDDRTYCV